MKRYLGANVLFFSHLQSTWSVGSVRGKRVVILFGVYVKMPPLRKKIKNEKHSKPVIVYSKIAHKTNIADTVVEPPNDEEKEDTGTILTIWQHNLSLSQPNTLLLQPQEPNYPEKNIPLDSLTMKLKPIGNNYGLINGPTNGLTGLVEIDHEKNKNVLTADSAMKLKPIHCTFTHDLSSSQSSIPVLMTLKPKKSSDEVADPFADIKATLHEYIFQLQKQKVTTMVHVFQQMYKNNHKSLGLGDFIRGCLFMFQFGESHHFAIQPLINHPIALVLKHVGGASFSVNTDLVSRIPIIHAPLVCYIDEFNTPVMQLPENIDYFGRYLYGLPIFNQTIFMYTNELPAKSRISPKHLAKLVHLFTPTDEMETFIWAKYEQMGIVNSNHGNHGNYMVVHVRIGDSSLIHGDTKSVERIIMELDPYLHTLFDGNERANVKIILISDSIALKHQLTAKYSARMVSLFDPIAHTGEGVQLSHELVRNTMLDFYIMSRATRIVSFTTHIHGSGFSQWCATIYQIPYVCKFMKMGVI